MDGCNGWMYIDVYKNICMIYALLTFTIMIKKLQSVVYSTLSRI